MASLKTLSTPQVARANSIEKTATTTIRLEDSDLEGSVTLFFNSSKDSLIYVNMRYLFYFIKHGRRDSNSRHLVLETSALPTELHPYKGHKIRPYILHVKVSAFEGRHLTVIYSIKISLRSQLPDLHLLFYHPHGSQNANQRSMQLEKVNLQ